MLAEYHALAAAGGMEPWPEKQYYNDGWETFGLYGFGSKRTLGVDSYCAVTLGPGSAVVDGINSVVVLLPEPTQTH